VQLGQLIFAELAQRLGQDAVNDQRARAAHFLAPDGEPVADGAAWPGHALDEPALDHPGRERAHRLVGLEGQLGERMQGRIRLPPEVAQHIPLHERDAKLGQTLVRGAVVTPLQPDTGHLPQLESPQLLLEAIGEFTESDATDQPG